MYNADIRQSLKILREIEINNKFDSSSTMRRKKNVMGEEIGTGEKMPDEGNSFKDNGTTYIFDDEKWKTLEGGVLKPKYQTIATKKWREEPKDEEPGVSGEPSDEVKKAAFSALRNTGLKAKESQVAIKRASSVLGADATEEQMIQSAFKYKDQGPPPEDVKKEPDKGGEEQITVNSTPEQTIQILNDKYGLKNREIIAAFKKSDIDYNSDEPIGKENIAKLVQVLQAANVKPEEDKVDDDGQLSMDFGEPTGDTLTADMEAQGKEIGDATPKDFIQFVKREKGASDEQAQVMVDQAGVDGPTIAGSEEELAKIVKQAEDSGELSQQEPDEEGGGGSEKILVQFEDMAVSGALRRAKLAAREAKKTNGADLENNLARLGAAYLIVNKLI